MRSRLARALLAAVLLPAALFAGCSDRPRTNPFDPANPETHGTPGFLAATAGDRQVRLEWDLSGFGSIENVRLLRSDSLREEQAGGGAGTFLDTSVANGSTYTYRLEVRSRGTVVTTAPALATPGASLPWIGASMGGMLRAAPDGRTVLFRVDSDREILDLVAAPDSTVWAADYMNGAVVHYDARGNVLSEWDEYGAAAIALDQVTGEIWVGAFNQRALVLRGVDGQRAWADTSAGLVEALVAAPSGGVWFGARGGGIGRVTSRTVVYRERGFRWPVALASNRDGSVWVADRGTGRVSRVQPDGLGIETSPVAFVSPMGGAGDGDGGFWVADPGRGGVSRIDARLAEILFLPLGPAESVTWDPVERRLWVVFPSLGTVSVVRVPAGDNPAWEVMASLPTGGRPVRVAGLWQ